MLLLKSHVLLIDAAHHILHIAWRDGIDSNLARRQFDRHRARELIDTAFCRAIRDQSIDADSGSDGRNVDNRTACALFYHLCGGQRGGERRHSYVWISRRFGPAMANSGDNPPADDVGETNSLLGVQWFRACRIA